MNFEGIILTVLFGQAFVNIGYLINLATRVTRIETHLLHLMKAEGVPVDD